MYVFMRNTYPLVNKPLYTIKANYEKHIERHHKSMLNTMKKHFSYSSDSLLETWVNDGIIKGINYRFQWDYGQNMRHASEADTHSGGHPDVFLCCFCILFLLSTNDQSDKCLKVGGGQRETKRKGRGHLFKLILKQAVLSLIRDFIVLAIFTR